MYSWLIFLHVLSVFGFLFAHGTSAMVMFRLRAERDPARLCALLDLSQGVGGAMAGAAALLFVTGLVLGFAGGWWGHGWIWTSLALFLAISFVMSWQGRLYFERVRSALKGPSHSAASAASTADYLAPRPASELAAALATGRPVLLAVVGLGGLAVITWLMMFRPF